MNHVAKGGVIVQVHFRYKIHNEGPNCICNGNANFVLILAYVQA
jgi:hypothetical protein